MPRTFASRCPHCLTDCMCEYLRVIFRDGRILVTCGGCEAVYDVGPYKAH